jgi:glycosyltransferase involved in cell wall biosynthesis
MPFMASGIYDVINHITTKDMKLTAVIITKNEENNIVDCIESLSFADEIVVVDNNSEDRTVEIAKKHGAKVYSEKFSDFAQQRNFGLEKAKGEWILYIDADERLTPKLQTEILSIIHPASPAGGHPWSTISAFRIPRKNYYFGQFEWPYVEKQERLFRKDRLKKWKGEIHESPVVDGELGELKEHLNHYTHRDLSSMVEKTNKWSEVESNLLYNSGHPQMQWWRFLRIMLTKFYDSFVKQGGWKIGTVGWIESIYQAFSYFIVYAKLWEKQNKIKSQNGKVKTTS